MHQLHGQFYVKRERKRETDRTHIHDSVNNSKFRWFHSTFNRFGFSGQEIRLTVFQCFSDTCMETKVVTSNLNPHDVDPDDPFDLKKITRCGSKNLLCSSFYHHKNSEICFCSIVSIET